MADATTAPEIANDSQEQSNDIRAAIASAIEANKAPEAKPAEKVEEVSADNAATDEEKDSPSPSGDATDKPSDPVAASKEVTTEDNKKEALKPPANWTKEDKAVFNRLPNDAKQVLLGRHKAMETDYTKKTEQLASTKRDAEALSKDFAPVAEMFKPFAPVMAQRGLSIPAVIQGWMNVERRFMGGDGANAIRDIAKVYGVDLAQLVQPQQSTELRADAQMSPELAAILAPLKQQLDALTYDTQASKVAQHQQAQAAQQQAYQAKLSEVETFEKAADKDGTPLHPYYQDVVQDMTAMAMAHRQSGQQPPDLAVLYDRAVWANPAIREKLLTAQTEAAREAERKAARAAAAKAKQAGVSVTTTGQPQLRASANQDGSGSLRDAIAAALALQKEQRAA